MALVVLAYARSAELPKPTVYRRHKLRDTSLRRHVA
jgi:hypothetical protein